MHKTFHFNIEMTLFIMSIALACAIHRDFSNTNAIYCLLVPATVSWILTSCNSSRRILRQYFTRVFPYLIIIYTLIMSLFSNTTIKYHQIGRLSGGFSNPNLFGILLCCGIIALLTLSSRTLCTNHSKPIVLTKSALFIILIAFFLINLALSFSRTAWICFAVSITYLLLITLLSRRNRGASYVTILVTFICTLCVAFIVVGSLMYNTGFLFLRRAFSVFNPADYSVISRVDAFSNACSMMLDNFWTGCGFSQYHNTLKYLYQDDLYSGISAISTNDYAIIMLSTGIIGTAPFALFIIRLLSTKCELICISPILDLKMSSVITILSNYNIMAKALVITFTIAFALTGIIFVLPISIIFWTAAIIIEVHA